MTGKICGTGSWVPDKVWDNNDLARMVETSDAWIRERTGVVQRHIAKENEDTVTMAARAAQKALEDAGMKAEEIDLIIVQRSLLQRSCPVWHVVYRSRSERKMLPALI